MKEKNQVTYRTLIKSGDTYYKLGHIVIKRYEGDIFYAPSDRGVTDASNKNLARKILDHFSWHESGRVHAKAKDGTRAILEEGAAVVSFATDKKRRQPIQNIGFQEIIRDTVTKITALPRHRGKIGDLDVVFDAGSYDGPVQFIFSMVSGRQIAKSFLGEPTLVRRVGKDVEVNRIGLDTRCLGAESDNADKLLQYALYKYTGPDPKKGRVVFIAPDSGIGRD